MPDFSRNPILNSPFKEPLYHWKLSEQGNITSSPPVQGRRTSKHFIPVPNPINAQQKQPPTLLPEESEEKTKVNAIREQIKKWQEKPIEQRAYISSTTKRLLTHWHKNAKPRLFFCQLEAAETFIWLNEVAPKSKAGKELLKYIHDANNVANPGLSQANPNLFRLAAKMATGAGKTTVMAMLIAYHAINKARKPDNPLYSAHFLIITPGITIKDRLRVLLPQDPENYYEKSTIVPPDMMGDVKKATIIITNYHSFKHRETRKLSKQQRDILTGNSCENTNTKENEAQMLHRVCPQLLRGAKNAVIINDEAHHCYIRKTNTDEEAVTQEEQEDVERNNEAARLWISGIKALGRKIKIQSVYDLSATPFFLRGSGYREGTLFPWVVSDFSLIEAIESGIVKLPRVPVKDATADQMPVYRNLYSHIRANLPRRGRGGQNNMDPEHLPPQLEGALQALYTHYQETSEAWEKENIDIPPVFIIVCNNTSTSKLIYDYISGYQVNEVWRRGRFPLFNNVEDNGKNLRTRPRTLLIDSYQLESGSALSDEFKKAATAEIDIFKRELRIRTGRDVSKISDEELLREVMNTVGKKERLGEQIRCVVSVSMLTEGWDTNNVTHILGVRAFGTQLLCEQVVGRALRRLNYTTEEDGKFTPEYADVFGVPFSFMPDSGGATPKPPKPMTRVRHLDERNTLEITYPRVCGYRIQPPETRPVANFTEDSRLTIRPEMAPPKTNQQGIAGKDVFFTLDDLRHRRDKEVEFFLTAYFCRHYYETKEGGIAPARFRDMMPIIRRYLSDYVTCLGGTFPQYLLWAKVAQMAAERIYRAIVAEQDETKHLLPLIDPYTPEGSTHFVDFLTSKKRLHKTAENKSHINLASCDSDWELNFCKYLEDDPGVFCYTRNDGLGFEVPYTHAGDERKYRPDFIILTDDGASNYLHLVVEIKGLRGEAERAKADTIERLWVPAVNNSGKWGRWRFLEITNMKEAREKLAQYTKGGRRK